MQQLNTQHIVHPLTQNTIKSFKSRAQVIFNLLENTHPPPPRWFTKFEFLSLFYIISTQRTYIYIYQKLDTNSCFAKLRAISSLFSFFYTPCSTQLSYIYIKLDTNRRLAKLRAISNLFSFLTLYMNTEKCFIYIFLYLNRE